MRVVEKCRESARTENRDKWGEHWGIAEVCEQAPMINARSNIRLGMIRIMLRRL